jgi:hypothetical protein
MRTFTVLSLVLVGLCIVVTSASIGTYRREPVPPALRSLRLTDCVLPCWIGIEPGRSTAEQARAAIEAAYRDSSEYSLSFAWADAKDVLPVILSEKTHPAHSTWIGLYVRRDRVVDSIVFYFDRPDEPVTLADVYNVFGAPSYVKVPDLADYRSGELALLYGSKYSGATVSTFMQNRLDWSQQVYTMVLYSHPLFPLIRASDLRPWQGFRTMASYGKP